MPKKSRYSSGVNGGKKPGPQAPKETPGGNDKKNDKQNVAADAKPNKLAGALTSAGDAVSKLADPGLNYSPSASSVRSGASNGATTIDPWRSFSTESGSVNDND